MARRLPARLAYLFLANETFNSDIVSKFNYNIYSHTRTIVNCGVISKPDSDGVGVTKKNFSESISELHERQIYMNKSHKMKYIY